MCFVDRCEVGTHHWAQCNDTPVKYARFPVTGLVEGRSYIFRVTALNKAGVSRPSRVSEAVVAMDPSDRARLRGERRIRVLLTSCNKANNHTFQLISSFYFSNSWPLSSLDWDDQVHRGGAHWYDNFKLTSLNPT